MAATDPIIDPLDGVSTTTVDEATRATLWRAQLAQRMGFRALVERSLSGDPVAAQRVRGAYQPLLNAIDDAQLPPAPDDDDMQTTPVTNQDLNL